MATEVASSTPQTGSLDHSPCSPDAAGEAAVTHVMWVLPPLGKNASRRSSSRCERPGDRPNGRVRRGANAHLFGVGGPRIGRPADRAFCSRRFDPRLTIGVCVGRFVRQEGGTHEAQAPTSSVGFAQHFQVMARTPKKSSLIFRGDLRYQGGFYFRDGVSTMVNAGSPIPISASTSTSAPSRPTTAQVNAFAIDVPPADTQAARVGHSTDIVVASTDDVLRYRRNPPIVSGPALDEGQIVYAA